MRLDPDPLGGLRALPRPPSWILWVEAGKGGERKEERRERRRGKGEKRKGGKRERKGERRDRP